MNTDRQPDPARVSAFRGVEHYDDPAAVHTLDSSRPTVEAVAVRDGRILAVGTTQELLAIDGAVVDGSLERFTLLPGFVEAHCHAMAGGMWLHTYCGYFDRQGPDGRVWSGCRSMDDVIERLLKG